MKQTNIRSTRCLYKEKTWLKEWKQHREQAKARLSQSPRSISVIAMRFSECVIHPLGIHLAPSCLADTPLLLAYLSSLTPPELHGREKSLRMTAVSQA